MLIQHGANVNVSDLWKFTPLHEAAAKGKYEIVRLLLQVIFFILFCFLFFMICKKLLIYFIFICNNISMVLMIQKKIEMDTLL